MSEHDPPLPPSSQPKRKVDEGVRTRTDALLICRPNVCENDRMGHLNIFLASRSKYLRKRCPTSPYHTPPTPGPSILPHCRAHRSRQSAPGPLHFCAATRSRRVEDGPRRVAALAGSSIFGVIYFSRGP